MRPAELAQIIAALPLEEARALVEALRLRLAVTEVDADALDDVGFFAVYGAPPPPERGDCVLVLQDAGAARLQVMALLRARLALPLSDAKEVVNHLPATLGPFEDRAWAEDLAAGLRAAGATVTLRDLP